MRNDISLVLDILYTRYVFRKSMYIILIGIVTKIL